MGRTPRADEALARLQQEIEAAKRQRAGLREEIADVQARLLEMPPKNYRCRRPWEEKLFAFRRRLGELEKRIALLQKQIENVNHAKGR